MACVSCRRVKAKCEAQHEDGGVCRRCKRLKLVCEFQPIDEEETRRTAMRKRLRAQQLTTPKGDSLCSSVWTSSSAPPELLREWCLVAAQSDDLPLFAATLTQAAEAGLSFNALLGNEPLVAQLAAKVNGHTNGQATAVAGSCQVVVEGLDTSNAPHLSALVAKAVAEGGAALCVFAEQVVNGKVTAHVNSAFEKHVMPRVALAAKPAHEGATFCRTGHLRDVFLHPTAAAALEALKQRLWATATASRASAAAEESSSNEISMVRLATETAKLPLRFTACHSEWREVAVHVSLAVTTWGPPPRVFSSSLFALAFSAPQPKARPVPPPPPAAVGAFGHAQPPGAGMGMGAPLGVAAPRQPPVSIDPLDADQALAALLGPVAEPSVGAHTQELFAVRALYDCVGERPGELTFRAGELISVLAGGPGDDWWEGRVEAEGGPERTGLFPSNYVSQSRVFRRLAETVATA